jgi:O-antigen/teichoic acid export membrane protein
MLVATVVAAIAAYLFQLVGGRVLGPTDFAPITVLWTIQFLVATTVFMPMEQLTVRRLSQEVPEAAPWRLYLAVIAACAVGALILSSLALDRLFSGNSAYLLILAPLIFGYGGFALGRGYLAGQRRFKEYAYSTIGESVVRLALAAAVLAAGAGALGLGWTLVIGSLLVWPWRPLHGGRRRGAALNRKGAATDLASVVTANAAAQTLVAAGPLVVGGLGASAADVSVFFQTFLLLRAPLTIAYNLVSRVLPPFTNLVEQGRVATIRKLGMVIGAGGAAAGAAGFGVGYLAGPAVVQALLGAEFRPGAMLAAAAAAGTALATVALFAQQLLIAMKLTGRLAAVWMAGLAAAAIAIGVGSGAPSLRVGWAFLIGEALSFAALVATIVSASQTGRVSEPRSR